MVHTNAEANRMFTPPQQRLKNTVLISLLLHQANYCWWTGDANMLANATADRMDVSQITSTRESHWLSAGVFLLQRLQPSRSHAPRLAARLRPLRLVLKIVFIFILCLSALSPGVVIPKQFRVSRGLGGSQGFPDVPGIPARPSSRSPLIKNG